MRDGTDKKDRRYPLNDKQYRPPEQHSPSSHVFEPVGLSLPRLATFPRYHTHGRWEGAARTSTLAFQRPSPRFRNPHACDIDLPLARIRGLAVGGHKPGANQIGQHINADPMRDAAVLQTCDGKQLKCVALVRVDFRSVQHLLEL
jgi:hypothetical protein